MIAGALAAVCGMQQRQQAAATNKANRSLRNYHYDPKEEAEARRFIALQDLEHNQVKICSINFIGGNADGHNIAFEGSYADLGGMIIDHLGSKYLRKSGYLVLSNYNSNNLDMPWNVNTKYDVVSEYIYEVVE
jgi:hypothetical protein